MASETAGAGECRRHHANARRDRGPGPLRPRRADVADIYDQGASAYEALWSPVILPPAAVLVRSLGLRGRCVIADIGAGTGALLGPIGSAAPAARVVALDASIRMLRIARTRRGASAVLADALVLPLADGTADAVILAYVLFHLADPARAATEAARVLRPGGRAGIITWAWERQPRASTVWDQVLAEAGVPPAPLRRVDSGLDQPGAVDALLRSAGLRPERIWHDRLRHEWDRSSFWELASGSGSNRIRLSQLGSAARAGVLARLTSTLSQLEAGDFVWEGEVICAVATKHSFGTDHPGKEPLPGARPIWNSLMAASGARRRLFLQCGIQRHATPAGWPAIGRISRVARPRSCNHR